MCGDCFVCIYLVCQCDGLELGRRNRRITVRGVAVRINKTYHVSQDPARLSVASEASDGACLVCVCVCVCVRIQLRYSIHAITLITSSYLRYHDSHLILRPIYYHCYCLETKNYMDLDSQTTWGSNAANEIHPKYALKKYRVQIACTLNKIYSPYCGHI